MNLRIAVILVVSTIVASFSCGEKPPPEEAFISTDRATYGFGAEFMTGVLIGTTRPNDAQVRNLGQKDLIITDVQKSGDSAFDFQLLAQDGGSLLPITVKGLRSTFIRLTFTPTAVQIYKGALKITSNASNFKELSVDLYGCGLRRIDAGVDEAPPGGCAIPQ